MTVDALILDRYSTIYLQIFSHISIIVLGWLVLGTEYDYYPILVLLLILSHDIRQLLTFKELLYRFCLFRIPCVNYLWIPIPHVWT